ncbi:chorismate synthase [Aureococcus anophagefferens]|nr:chorismate synthase [Aureococcus anophagefferens]
MRCFVALAAAASAFGPRASYASRSTVRMGMGNSFGRLFRISTWGESHGGGVGVVVDGCPPRVPLSEVPIQFELDRRRPGQSRLTTPRNEATRSRSSAASTRRAAWRGTPIAMLVRNKDQRSQDYKGGMTQAYRPSHADATYDAKYGVSARRRRRSSETIGASRRRRRPRAVTIGGVERPWSVPARVRGRMIARIDEIRRKGNSIGGVVTCVAQNVPAGLGSPGGISNGETIVVRVAFKPTSTIGQLQATRAPMVESMVALTLMDALMQQKAQCELLDFEADGGFNPSDQARTTASCPRAAEALPPSRSPPKSASNMT